MAMSDLVHNVCAFTSCTAQHTVNAPGCWSMYSMGWGFVVKWLQHCICRQLFNAQTRKLQIAKETVAKRSEKDPPAENEVDADGTEETFPPEEENE